MDEQLIIEGIKNKNEECFNELVNLYKKKIVGLCYSYTEDYQEAEDISQEIFISIYKNINNFRGESSLSTYIYRITINKCLDYKRKRSIKGFLNGLFSIKKYEENIDDRAFIRQCVIELPEELRTPVVLYYYVGLSQKEIAEVLKVSPKTIEGRIYRAKGKLKIKFEQGGFVSCRKSGII